MQVLSLIGKKMYQKQGFLQDGTRVPLTGVAVAGNFVSQIKTLDKEGYNALQIGFGTKKKAKKRDLGHSKKAGLQQAPRFFKEIRVDDMDGATAGAQLNASEVFAPGDIIDVTGTSKGKGWAGGVKRYHFKGGPRTHGQSDRERAPGSIGQTTTPGRVYKGKKMAGRMGHDTVTLKNLEVIEITSDGMLLINGLIPGSLNSIVTVKKVGQNKKFVPLYKEVVEEPVVEETKQDEAAVSETKEPEVDIKTEEVKATESADLQPEVKEEETKVDEKQEEVKEDAKS